MAIVHTLFTARLRLVPVDESLKLVAAQGRAELEEALGARTPPTWRGEHVFAHARRARLAVAPRHAVVVHRGDRLVIGDVRFEPRVGGEGLEIGYSIIPDYRRQGYASEAAQALVAALRDRGAGLLVAGCRMDNRASVRILRKLGFHLDGSTVRGAAFWWTLDPSQAV